MNKFIVFVAGCVLSLSVMAQNCNSTCYTDQYGNTTCNSYCN